MAALESALSDLQQIIHGNRAAQNWPWLVRQGLSSVRQALQEERFGSFDGWLNARSRSQDRERLRLMARISALGPAVLDRLEPRIAAEEVQRLLTDIDHYLQRLHDLFYDSVGLELGGSE